MNSCKNCDETVNGNYCANCGQAAELKRIDRSYIISEIANSLSVEKGMLYTIRKMLISPGESVRQYITEDRSRYVKPITFVIITSLIYTIVCHLFHVDAKEINQQMFGQTESLEEFPAGSLLTNWIIDNSGYVSIIIGFLMAFWVKLLFRKYGYNLFEIFVLFCYISGITTLLSSVFFIIQGIARLELIFATHLITAIYTIWAIGQFFDKKKAGSYIKAFLSYVLGFLILWISLSSIIVLFTLY